MTIYVTPPSTSFSFTEYIDWLVANVGARDFARENGGPWCGVNWEMDFLYDGSTRVWIELPDERTATAFLLRWA